MAPEQLAQGKVSVRSDIYTLGLILHELFTGKCVFDTNDIEELKRKHTSGSVTTPSSIAEEIDPAVERVTMRCLETDPAQRPQSVYQVLAALPGGDPLAAALAAGETPSPELVANARDAGGLRPVIAVGLLGAILASLALGYWMNAPLRVMPKRAPQELSFVADQVMAELGYADLPRNSASGYRSNVGLAVGATGHSPDELQALDWPPRYRYWKRWTAGSFLVDGFHAPEKTAIDGPVSDPERTATISFDSTGRLRGLIVGAGLSQADSDAHEPVDSSTILRLAGLAESEALEVPVAHQPPVHCGTLQAWRIDHWEDARGEPMTIQLGFVGPRPNYFEVIGLDDLVATRGFPQIPAVIIIGVILVTVVPISVLVLAWRNVRRSRGDWRNALRCALIVAVLYALLEMLAGRWPDVAVDLTFSRAGGHVALHAVVAFLVYLAIEPYVRRVWPRMLVGLVRLLSGRLRDPVVGREALFGVAITCVVGVLFGLVLSVDAHSASGSQSRGILLDPDTLGAIMSVGGFVADRVHQSAWAVLLTFLILGFLVIVRLLTRHTLAAVLVSIAAIGAVLMQVMSTAEWVSTWQAVVCGLLFGASVVLLFTQVGFIAAFVAVFLVVSSRSDALGSDFDAWTTPYGIADLAIPIAIALYAFWISLAGQPIFKDMLAEP
ncbi:MAG: protein kinase domain-containing protein, partial [Planctomycetota bacterium]